MESPLLPCYVVCDVSSSMSDHLDEVNAGLREFRGAVHADPAVAALVRVCVVGFAEEPLVLQPLRPAAELGELSGARPCAGTNFGRAFTFLRDTVDRDVHGLKAQRLRVRRPVVFFTSDGRPTDGANWASAFAAFDDPEWAARPHVVAFGVGAADQVTLSRIGTFGTFLRRDGVRIGAALSASVASSASRPEHV